MWVPALRSSAKSAAPRPGHEDPDAAAVLLTSPRLGGEVEIRDREFRVRGYRWIKFASAFAARAPHPTSPRKSGARGERACPDHAGPNLTLHPRSPDAARRLRIDARLRAWLFGRQNLADISAAAHSTFLI